MHNRTPLAAHDLANGLRVELLDVSRHYYGGYWQVALEASCQVPLSLELFDDPGEFADARRLLGMAVPFVRRLEKMAVRQDLVEKAIKELRERFEKQLLPFLAGEKFPAAFISSELEKQRKKTVRSVPCLP